MDSEDSSSYANASSGDEPSSDANIPYVPSHPSSGDESSASAAMVSSDPSSEAKIPYVDQLEGAMIDSTGSSEDDTGPSGLTSDELLFKALETVYDDGNGLDIDGIFNFIEERYEILEDFREQLEDQLGDLVLEGQVEKVGNRYKISHGHFDIPRQSEEASNPTQTMSSGDSTSTKSQDTPSTSFVPTAPEENPQIDAAVKEVAEAEHLEFQAKEALELADKHVQLLKLESHIILQLAVEILNRCANGHKIFLR